MKIKEEHMGKDMTIIGDHLMALVEDCEIEWKGERHFLVRCSEMYSAIALDNYEPPIKPKRKNALTQIGPLPEGIANWLLGESIKKGTQ
jgi:hypothetical protein